MELLDSILRITMVLLLVRAVFTIVTGFLLSKKVKQAREDQTEINIKLKEIKEQQQAQLQHLMVRDDNCGKLINKEKAYIVRLDDHLRHFCSWDCRQKFLEKGAQPSQ